MANPQFPDLQVTQYFDPSDKNYFNTDVKGLTADTLYGFNFQWVFEDEDLNAKYNTLWSNTFLVQTIPLPLAESTDIVAAWDATGNLIITWTSPTHSTGFTISLTGTVLGTPRTVFFGHKKDVNTTSQKMTIYKNQLISSFGGKLLTTLTGVLKTDYINSASTGVAFTIPGFTDLITGSNILDADWSLTATDGGFFVSWKLSTEQLSLGLYDWTEIWWADPLPDGSEPPIGSYTSLAVSSGSYGKQGVTSKKWIKIRYYTVRGTTSNYSNGKSVSPYVATGVDSEGPPDTSTVTVTGGIDTTKQIGFNGYAIISWDAVRSILADGVTKTGLRGYRVKFWPVNPSTGVALTSSDYSYRDFPGAGNYPGTITGRINELAVGSTYKFAVATYDEYNNTSSNYVESATSFSVPGTPFIANVVDVKGYFQAQTGNDVGAFKFGYGIESGKRGLTFNANNYWYITSDSTALLKVGGSDNYLSWDGAALKVEGNISAKQGNFSGNVQLASGASVYSGTLTSETLETVTINGLPVITKRSGGELNGDGWALNSTGLIIKKGTNVVQIKTSDGSLTANKGNIANWDIAADTISSGGKIGLYAPIVTAPATIPDATVAIWAGGTKDGTTTKFKVTYGGVLTATDVDLRGKIKAVEGFFGTDAYLENSAKGFKINGNTIESLGFAAGTSKLILNGETGEISGGTIVANSFKTSPTAGTSNAAGIKIDSTGLYAYNGTKATVAIAAGTGKLIAYEAEIYGDFKAGSAENTAYILSSGDFRLGNSTQYVIGNSSGMSIKMGSYTIKDSFEGSVNIFQITGENGQDILKVSNIVGNDLGGGVYGDLAQADEGRLYLGAPVGNGSKARQTQVMKSAQVAGSSENYLSGGLRNIFTMEETYWTTAKYPNAKSGDVVFVYKAGS